MFTALSKSYAPFGNGTLELETTPTEMTHKMREKMRDETSNENEEDMELENG
jgi:hypothetical protein